MKRIAVAAVGFTLFLSTPSLVHGLENLIGRVVDYAEFDTGELEPFAFDLSAAEIVVFDFNHYRFVDAVEIRAELPSRLLNRVDVTFAALVYGDLADAPPQSGELTTRAQRLHFEPMVNRTRFTVRIPVRQDSPERGRSQRIDTAPDPTAFPLALTFLPIGKGLPEDLPDHTISVEVRPVSRGVGELVLDISNGGQSGTEEESIALESLPEYRLSIAGSARESETLFLEPGFHDVVFETPGYRTFSATAAVQEGQRSRLSVELEPHPASLFLDAPRGTQVYINDTIIGSRLGTSIELEPGEHEIVFRIGGRSVTRVLQLEPGGSYTARVEIGVDILESEENDSGESENGDL